MTEKIRGRALWRAEAGAMVALAWPLILTNVSQTAMTTTDVVLLGRVGPDALAASAIGFNLFFALNIFASGLVTATAPMIARELGANRFAVREVRRTFRQGLWTSLMIVLPFWAILWQAEPILHAFGQTPELARDATTYIHALQWAMLPQLVYVVLRSFVSAMGRPRSALYAGIFGLLVNIAVAWVLIFGELGFPALGLTGAGLATTIASWASTLALGLFIALDRRFRRWHLFGHFWRPDGHRLLALWKLGLPIGTTLAFEVTVFNASTMLMGLIGVDAVAAHAIALQAASLTFMVPLGISQAITVRVGLGYGARDGEGIRRAAWTGLALTESFMVLVAAAMIFAPHVLIGFFVDLSAPANQAVIALAAAYLGVGGIFQIGDGAQAASIGVLRGLHDTRVPMLIAGLGYWGIGLVTGALLAFHFGFQGVGIWTGLATGIAVVSTALSIRWMRRISPERLALALA